MRFLHALVGAGLMAAVASASAATITFTDATGDPGSVFAAPGATFQVKASLTLDDGEAANGITFFLGASQSGIFTIVNREIDVQNPFSNVTSNDPTALSASPGLNPTNGVDLGGITADFNTRPAGTYPLYTLTLQVSPTAVGGTYLIDARDVQLSDENYDTFFGASASYAVTVPEPGVFAALAATSVGLMIRRRAK